MGERKAKKEKGKEMKFLVKAKFYSNGATLKKKCTD